MSPFPSLSGVFRCLPDILPNHWRRRRGCLGPPQVFLSLMFMSVLGTKGYERTIQDMKSYLGHKLGWGTPDKLPTASALCQARRKLDAKQCRDVMAQVYRLCTTARTHASLTYAGLRLLAIDGTKLALPAYRCMQKHFGCPTDGAGKEQRGPQASLVVLWDVGANQPVDWRLGRYRESERALGQDLFASLKPGDLLIADRGIPSRRIITQLSEQRADFVMRIACGGIHVYGEIAPFLTQESDDVVISFRLLGNSEPVPLRLLRHRLPDGSAAIYLTSLIDQPRHPHQELIALYTQRWRIETAFRELKLWHGLERFHARHVDGIAQEVCAMMVFQLFASELEARARHHHQLTIDPESSVSINPSPTAPPPFRLNRRIVADCVVCLLHAGTKDDDEIRKEFDQSLFRLWRYRQQPRPGRSFPRERKSSTRGWKDRGTKGKGRP